MGREQSYGHISYITTSPIIWGRDMDIHKKCFKWAPNKVMFKKKGRSKYT